MRIFVLFLVAVGAAAASVWLILSSFGHFDAVTRDFAGRCAPVRGVAGPEDMAPDYASGRVFISSLDRRAGAARGAVYLVDPDDPLADGGWRDMTAGAPADFRPLGLSFYDDGAVRRLFVVNAATDAVELFDVAEDGALEHLESFTEPRLTSPNNVAAVGPRSFYVTNDVKAGRGSMAGDLNFLFRAGAGAVLFSDGVTWRVAATGLKFANGVAVSADGAQVYVAETAAGSVRVFDRNRDTNALVETATTRLPAAPDNLTVAPDGSVWAAALPKPLALRAHAGDGEARAPSAIYRLTPDGAARLYQDDGGEVSAASVAAPFGGKFLVGALFENKFLICELPDGEI